jgi:hypothetical protein
MYEVLHAVNQHYYVLVCDLTRTGATKQASESAVVACYGLALFALSYSWCWCGCILCYQYAGLLLLACGEQLCPVA